MEDPRCIIIAEQAKDDFTQGFIKYIDKLKFTELMIDVSDPRLLMIASKSKVLCN